MRTAEHSAHHDVLPSYVLMSEHMYMYRTHTWYTFTTNTVHFTPDPIIAINKRERESSIWNYG